MRTYRIARRLFWWPVLAMICATCVSNAYSRPVADTLSAQITDAEFWRMATEFSVPNGDYPYDNWISNEDTVQSVIPALKQIVKPGGVYIGVAPEQNFTRYGNVKLMRESAIVATSDTSELRITLGP